MLEYVHLSEVARYDEKVRRDFYADGLGYGELESAGEVPLYFLGTDIKSGYLGLVEVRFVDMERSEGLRITDQDLVSAIEDDATASLMIGQAARLSLTVDQGARFI